MDSVAVKKMEGLFVHSMGKTSGKAIRGLSPGSVGNKYNPQFWNVVNVEPNPVENVTDVQLDHLRWAMGWVGKEDFTKDSFEAPTKLHCFHCSKGESVFVDPPPAVVTNPTGATAALGDNPGRRTFGVAFDCQMRLIVIMVCGSNRSHRLGGKSSATPDKTLRKWALKLRIATLVALRW
jgi:hypothetical protein